MLISRHFVEMNRSRIEGLLATFPKLIGSKSRGVQHTFVETESVRYVYQPLEKLYVLLVTTKASNILEDLETLRLFAKVIPEYSRGCTEADIIANAFELIFAFDEIVSLGYRENVNLATVRTFMEMDSQEERNARAKREAQEREAKEIGKRKLKEMQAKARENAKRGGTGSSGRFGSGGGYGGFGSDSTPTIVSVGGNDDSSMNAFSSKPNTPAVNSATSRAGLGSGKALKLGSHSKNVDSFVDQLKAEGERVQDVAPVAPASSVAAQSIKSESAALITMGLTPVAQQEAVHCTVRERLTLSASRDGGLDALELVGELLVRVAKPELAAVRFLLDHRSAVQRGVMLQTHPNIDKLLFQSKGIIQAKQGGKPYPVGQEFGVLKWRFQTQEESNIPLTINCWPNETGASCEVNIEYELQATNLELRDVVITIPLPGGNPPSVNQCEGTYDCDARHTKLVWRLALVDADNRSGQLDFTIKGGHADDFFPVTVGFRCLSSYCGLKVLDVVSGGDPPGGDKIKFTSDSVLIPEKYEVV